MDSLTIRTAVSTDIHDLTALDHGYSTEQVWQMASEKGDGQMGVSFRQVRLPRPMRVSYPRDPLRLIDDWSRRLAVLVAEWQGILVGYLSLVEGPAPDSGWATDLAVGLRYRRQGVGGRLLAAGCTLSRQRELRRLFIEMQSKNAPAVALAKKMGFAFCGYSDQYYPNEDIALFFALDLQ